MFNLASIIDTLLNIPIIEYIGLYLIVFEVSMLLGLIIISIFLYKRKPKENLNLNTSSTS